MQNKPFRAALLIAVLSLPALAYAQNVSGNRRVDANVGAQDPFAIRAGNSQTPVMTPKAQGTSMQKAERPVKTAANDLLYLKEQSEPIACAVLTISGNGGVTAQVQDKPYAFPFAALERVELSVSNEFQEGVDAFESGKRLGAKTELERALDLFKGARQKTARRIEKEWATAKIVETYSALGRDDEAASEFFLLCRIDPYSPYLSSMPLRWVNQTSLTRGSSIEARTLAETTAATWLSPTDNPSGTFNPSDRLLAASILMNSNAHSRDAVAAMQALIALEAPQGADQNVVETCRAISLLAAAQLWRGAVLRKPTEREVAHWISTVEKMPGELTLGPAFLVAQAQKTLEHDESAAHEFLRVAMLADDKFTLAEAASKQAADAYERLGQTDAAQKIRDDAARRFGN